MVSSNEQCIICLSFHVGRSVATRSLDVDVGLLVLIKKVIQFMMGALHSVELLLHLVRVCLI